MTHVTDPAQRTGPDDPHGPAPEAPGLTGWLEGVEQGITRNWRAANAAITDTAGEVAAAAENTLRAAQGAVGRALDLRAHLRRHPWVVLGGGLLLGVLLARLLARPGR